MLQFCLGAVAIRRALFTASLVIVALLSAVLPTSSQTRTANLAVTVVDQTGAVVEGATVTATGTDDVTKAAGPTTVTTSKVGIATLENLPPGRYTIQAQFPGFEPRVLADVPVRPGNNKQVALLTLAGVQDSVTVARDRQEVAVDPRGPSFGTQLTREQIEALSDDPAVLRQQLEEMAGPGAVIKVDSFEGGALPPKAQIRSIRISRDQFAAENHSAGGTSIEIITQPGLGPIRYNAGARFRDGSLSGRSPFTPTKGPEQQSNFFIGLSGTLIPQKSSFSFFVNGATSYETPNINIVDATGTRSEPLPLRTPRDNVNVSAQLDYALTLDHTLRVGYSSNLSDAENLGIGEYNEEERAYSTEDRVHNIRAQHIGPLGRRAFTRSRVQARWSNSESRSAVELPTIRVNDAFTRGGAQVGGGQRLFGFTFGSDLDYVRGIHSLRTGIVLDGGNISADDTSNYLGTYTFESLDAYLAGQPRSFTRRIGDPRISYSTLQAAVYGQDDIKIRRNFTLSVGARYEAQRHVSDYGSVMPRVGFTWAPFKSGTTVLRSSWGIFYDWLHGSTYEQTLRVDGFRQRELDIRDPSYPELPAIDAGVTVPVSRYVLGENIQLPRMTRVSLGIDQRVRRLQMSAVYAYLRGSDQYRGNNLNAPVDGVRPDPSFGNVIEVVSDGSSRQHQLQTALTANPGALLPLGPSAPRINWKRTTLFVNYTFGIQDNYADGPFSLPATGRLAADWGPAAGDVRHRFNASLNNQIIKNLLVALNVNVNTATPYSIRTGLDDNGDFVFNDRPAGVGRNTERGDTFFSLNPFIAYVFAFGRNISNLPPGIAVIGGGAGGAPTVQTVNQPASRYRLQLFVAAQNVTNHANYSGYSGTMTSPFFGQPTNVLGTRKIDIGMSLTF
jgi:Carboxypeptidase regulatory-like domain